ncbi:MAG TPA: PQQ-binding-like beta-propeller repeat protein [Candidatus Polarisedimenticolia bacterium]|nr:PQQ-binding-like beta-propeller repeat protein [Candidatus Polarisedimenticolia bacterium]
MRRHPALVTMFACFILICATSHASPAAGTSWPGLRGPSYDGAVRDAKLAVAGGKVDLTLGWKRDLGSGYSVLAAGDGRLIAMFSAGDGDFAAAYKQETGEELWRYRIEEIYKGHDGSHDGPIASPLLAGGRVFGFSPRGILFAVDAATGKAIWSKNLVADLGAKSPYYGFTCSPIMAGGALIVQIGAGEGKSIAGFKPEDGTLLWSAGNDEVNYQSPIAATIGGRAQVLAAGGKTLWGLDPASGKVLWSYEHKGDESAMGGQKLIPVPAGENRFLLVNKEDSSTMISVTPGDGGTYQVKELWSKNSIRGTYVIPVVNEGYIYGVSGFILTCVDAATGETKWKSREPGDGFLTLVGGHLVILTKQGTLHVADASPTGYHEIARMGLFDEQSWSAVAYADGHLFARSMAHLARIDVVAQAATPAVTTAQSWIDQTEFGRFLADAAKSSDKGAAIDKYLAGQKSFPIVESMGSVHFVYRGKATDVAIVGDMLGDRREDPMLRLPGTDLFYYSTRLEPDASITYGYIVDYEKPIPDPRNARKGSGMFGDLSMLAMPAWRQSEFTAPAAGSSQGRLETLEFTSHVGGKEKKRTAQVYLPAGYDSKAETRYPTLYVHDGKDALEKGEMKNALDALIGSKAEPVIAVFVHPDPNNPQGEFWRIDPYVEMVVTDLVPKIDETYRTVRQPWARASAGAGGGANEALACVLKHPDVFQRLGSQSAFVLARSDYEGQIPAADKQPLVVFLRWGTYDIRSSREAWDTARGNRELWTLMRDKGHTPSGGESPEGTGWSFWRGHTGEMITALFPAR